MKYNKFKAFTLAEIMVLLLTLSILLAAFAPVFTRRYQNVTSDEVWTFISGDDEKNAYFDAPNKMFVNQAFLGLQPIDSGDVLTLTKNGQGEVLYSKFVIAASKKLGPSFAGAPQNQMQFRYAGNSSQGVLVGSLFAGNGNMLLGGPYSNITNDALENASFGYNTLKELTKGSGNTAVGAGALKNVTEGNFNTAIGYNAGAAVKTGGANTLIGYEAGANMLNSANENTLIGYQAGRNIKGNANTAVGYHALGAGEAGEGNTAVGAYALKYTTGKYNTALGSSALINLEKGNYNTAVGAYSCMFAGKDHKEMSKITCIGANSASEAYTQLPEGTGDGDVPDRVFIGTPPNATSAGTLRDGEKKPYAVVEVHNSVNEPNKNMNPIPNGEESVIINGNLIVRGLSYFEVPIIRAAQQFLWFPSGAGSKDNYTFPDKAPKALTLFRLVKLHGTGAYSFSGFDGTDRKGKTYAHCNGCREQKQDSLRPNCICTSAGPGYHGDTNFVYKTKDVRYSSTSYDWNTKATNHNGALQSQGCGSDAGSAAGGLGATYVDMGTCKKITLSNSPFGYGRTINSRGDRGRDGSRESDYPYAHLPVNPDTKEGYACCPNLSSTIATSCETSSGSTVTIPTGGGGGGGGYDPFLDDGSIGVDDRDHLKHHEHKYQSFHSSHHMRSDIRLKDVGEKFTAGLDEIKKLNVYHFTFKNDVNKIPHVGVMAQDLKVIFPSAVVKGDDGYYRIRWDEMLYAAINAVKTLNSKIETLASKIATDKDRIAALKRDNAEMYVQLDKLADELEVLEAKKK